MKFFIITDNNNPNYELKLYSYDSGTNQFVLNNSKTSKLADKYSITADGRFLLSKN